MHYFYLTRPQTFCNGVQGATVGEPSDGPIVLDDSDEDVDVETVDDFAEGADVEVRKNGATPWAGEAWSPGRVRRSARLALTVEIQVQLLKPVHALVQFKFEPSVSQQ